MDRASGVWTVRGVSAEARKVAKAKAAGKGWTLGQWIERAIEIAAWEHGEEPGKKSPTIREVVDGKVLELGPVVDCEVTEEAPPIRAHARKPRSVCQHGVEKGYNCWQCGGLAVIR